MKSERVGVVLRLFYQQHLFHEQLKLCVALLFFVLFVLWFVVVVVFDVSSDLL